MKNSYYFPHDYHARHDPKLEKLFFNMQYEGMGIYWGLIERLYEQSGYMNISDLVIYANGDKSLCERITRVVQDFELFKIKDGKFWSESCLRRLSIIAEKSTKASQSAYKRWAKDTNAMPTQCEGNAVKESKEKKVNRVGSDDDFLKTLKANTAYQHVDITNELAKMDAWFLTHPGRQKTRRFIVNWLNKIERPLETVKKIGRGDV